MKNRGQNSVEINNMIKARDDAASPQVIANIEQDLADAAALNVTRTPGFFVNGRPLKDFGHQQLKAFVEDEVALAYGAGAN